MSYCSHCGAQLLKGGEVCEHCGKRLGLLPAETGPDTRTPEQKQSDAIREAVLEEISFCSHCGIVVPHGEFCSHCGAHIESEAT